jgi:hypothetical protein
MHQRRSVFSNALNCSVVLSMPTKAAFYVTQQTQQMTEPKQFPYPSANRSPNKRKTITLECGRRPFKVGFAFFQNGQRPISSEIRSRSKCKRHNAKKKKQHTNVAVHVTVTQRKCVRWPVLRRGRRKSPIIIISNVTLSMRKRPLNGRHG